MKRIHLLKIYIYFLETDVPIMTDIGVLKTVTMFIREYDRKNSPKVIERNVSFSQNTHFSSITTPYRGLHTERHMCGCTHIDTHTHTHTSKHTSTHNMLVCQKEVVST